MVIYMGVLLKMLAKPRKNQSGFADHEIPFLNGYFIGKINPTFSDKPLWLWTLRCIGYVCRGKGTHKHVEEQHVDCELLMIPSGELT